MREKGRGERKEMEGGSTKGVKKRKKRRGSVEGKEKWRRLEVVKKKSK